MLQMLHSLMIGFTCHPRRRSGILQLRRKIASWILLATLGCIHGCGTRALTIDEMYDRAAALCDHGRGEEALQVLDQIVDSNPHPRSFYLRGVAHELNHEYDQAVSSYDQCLQQTPEDSDALNNRGSVLYRLGQFEASVADLIQALAINSGDHLAWSNLSLAQQRLNRLDEALASLKRAKSIQNQASYGLQMGNLLLQLNQAEDAEQVLTESINKNPHNASSYLSRAIARIQMGKLDLARSDLALARRYDVGLALHLMIERSELLCQAPSTAAAQ
jgi:tetratricopeptide (TPR) repeat protein